MSSADHETDSDELDPDEPRTPMWLPLLGGGLFLLALLLFLATRSDEEPVAENTADATAAAAAAAAAAPAPAEQAPAERAPAQPARNEQAPDDQAAQRRPRVLRAPSPTDEGVAAPQRPGQQRRAVQRTAEPRPAPGHEDHGH